MTPNDLAVAHELLVWLASELGYAEDARMFFLDKVGHERANNERAGRIQRYTARIEALKAVINFAESKV